MAIARSVDRRLFFIIDRHHAQLSKTADRVLRKSTGVGSAQAAVLTYLGYHDGCRISELADGVGHNRSALTALSDRMEKGGLIAKKDMIFDGRGKTVTLTEAGWEKRAAIMDVMRDFNDTLRQGFSEQQLDTVLKFLSESEKQAEKFEAARKG